MDRRVFIKTAGALSLAAAGGELSLAAGDAFDPTEQSIQTLQRSLTTIPAPNSARFSG